MSKIKLPVSLKQAIKKKRLIIFVGAGLSYNLVNSQGEPLKGWGNLVLKIIEHLKSLGYNSDILLPLLDFYDPIQVLNLIEVNKAYNKNEISKFLKNFLLLDRTKNEYKIHEKLFQISKKIITTNYDTAFENAIPDFLSNTAFKDKNYELTTLKEPEATLLFKLHGCYLHSDSMVLFPSDYRDLYQNPDRNAEHSLSALRNVIFNNSVLFIGTGMGDFQINNIFKEVQNLQGEHNQNHFIITNKNLDSKLDFLTPIKIDDFSQIETIVDEIVKIKQQFEAEDSAEVTELKFRYKELKQELDELKKIKFKPSLDANLEQEAYKNYKNGIENQLINEYQKAIEDYKMAIVLYPHFPKAYNNLAGAMIDYSKTKPDSEGDKISKTAFAFYKKAISMDKDYHESYYNWGLDLAHLAKTKKVKEAKKLYLASNEKYESAIKIKNDKDIAYNNWGNNLARLANMASGEEMENLYQQAFDKYAEALKIIPNKSMTLNNWGTNLIFLAKRKSKAEAEILFEEAIPKLIKAIEFGGNAYNLSCLYALRKMKDPALKYLKKSLERKEITSVYVKEIDEDWAYYRNDSDFTALLDQFV